MLRCFDYGRAMLETLLREMDEEGMGDDSGETVVHDNEQARRMNTVHILISKSFRVLNI